MCDDKSFVRSAALRVYKGPSGAGKTEIPANTQLAHYQAGQAVGIGCERFRQHLGTCRPSAVSAIASWPSLADD